MNNKNYLSEIDSIRGIAILLVILFHFDLFFESGFLGVDVFFVISGFLITKILEESKKNSNWVLFFFNKRIRRIIPILFLTIILVLILSVFILSPVHLKRLTDSATYSLFGISNLFFFSESGYFDFRKDFKPLLHTWSLAVEIQLYLLWFGIYFFFIKNFKKFKFHIVISLIFLSLFLSIIYSNRATSFFYFTGFRLYEFAFGALGYYISKKDIGKKFGDYSFLFSIVSILFLSKFFKTNIITENGYYNSIQSLSVVIPTFIILLSIKNLNFTKLFLNNKWLIKMGKISYSLYLIHWPILIFFFYSGKFEKYLGYKILLIIFSILLAYISYNFIEIYFRKFKNKDDFYLKDKILFPGLVIFIIFFTFISSNALNLSSKINNTKKYNQIIDNLSVNQKILQNKYYIETEKLDYFNDKNNLKNILVIGDSHAWDIYYSLSKISQINNNSNFQFYNMGLSSCFLFNHKENLITKFIKKIFNTYNHKDVCKKKINDKNMFKAISRADKIILGARWNLNSDFKKMINFFNQKTNAEIIVIDRINTFFDPPTLLFKNGDKVNEVAYRKKQEITYKINKNMVKILSQMKVKYIDRSNFFCRDKYCTIYYNNKLLFADQDHLTEDGHIYQSKLFKKTKILDFLFF